MRLIILLLLFVFSFGSQAQTIVVNEYSSSNDQVVVDEDNDAGDWIELYNTTDNPIQLNGYGITDDPTEPYKWTFASTEIPGKSFLLIFADDKDRTSGTFLHTNFKLKASGEPIVLTDDQGQVVDSVPATALLEDVSYGRQDDGTDNWFYFYTPTPGTSNTTTGAATLLDPPTLDQTPGFYTTDVSVTLSHGQGADIYYTLDGSDPTEQSNLFSGAITFSTLQGVPNGISTIPTNPGFTYPVGDYTEVRANNRGWLPPLGEIQKANVIKARAFKDGQSSSIISGTYLVHPDGANRYSLPVFSIVSDSNNFFNADSGIYVFGNHPEGNFRQKGSEWERLMHIEIFDVDGSTLISQGGSMRMHGNGSTYSALKNIRLYADGDNGPEFYDYAFFEDKELDTYRRLILKGSGQRPDCFPRDELSAKIVKHLPLSVQEHRNVIVYLNGEYWGIHGLKERYDDWYLYTNYNIERDVAVILTDQGQLDEGIPEDSVHYANFIKFVSENDMGLSNNYEQVKTIMDVDNYIDYQLSEIFLGNGDWPNGNIRFWRKRTNGYVPGAPFGHDGRYRWMLYDIDNGYGGSCNQVTALFNTLRHATSTDPGLAEFTILFRSLLENAEFRATFINRFADMMNTMFNEDRVNGFVDEIKAEIDQEITEHVNRWRYPSIATTLADRANEVPNLTKWNQNMAGLRAYTKERLRKQRDHIIEYFSFLSDTSFLNVNVSNAQQGYVRVNSINLHESEVGVDAPVYPWSGKYFNNQTFPIKAVPYSGYEFVEWANTGITDDEITVSLSGDSTFTAVFQPINGFSFSGHVYINEIMADNESTIQDNNGDFDDWIELYNPNDYPVDLSGYYITDKDDNATKFQFAFGEPSLIIPAKGFLLVWADDEPEQGPLHTNFGLSKNGEFVGLYAPDGATLVDSIRFGALPEDESYGRSTDGGSNLRAFDVPTPGATNATTSVGDVLKTTKVLVAYPNPAQPGWLYFNQKATGTLLDMTGRPVGTVANAKKLNTTALTAGVYIFRSVDGQHIRIIIEE